MDLPRATQALACLLNESKRSDEGKGEDLYLVGKVNGALYLLSALGLQSQVLNALEKDPITDMWKEI